MSVPTQFSLTFCLVITVYIGIFIPLSAETRTATIKATELSYNDATQEMMVSGNVTVESGSFQISGDRLTINTEKNQVSGTGNIRISQGENSYQTTGILVNLDDETAELSNIDVQVTPPGNPRSLFLHAKRYHDTPSIKFGQSATLTSCELPNPHYVIWSQQFDYKPDQYILAYNNWLWMPIMGIPFGLWTPAYYYELGKRSIIWNIPTIGRREVPGWGWFVQNTIDYDEIDGESASILIDWFENKGIGLGFKHPYKIESISGNVYYYNLVEQDTGRVTQKKAAELGYQYGPHRIDSQVESIDGERLTASGRDTLDFRKIGYTYTNLGEIGAVVFSDRTDYRQNTNSTRVSGNYGLNGQSIYRFGYTEDRYSNFQTIISSVRGGATWALPARTVWRTETLFDRESVRSANDDRLRLTTDLTKQWDPTLKTTLTIDTTWDLDGDTVTRDIESGRNNVMYSLPKLVISHSDSGFPVPITQELTIARLQEYAYIASQKAVRVYPDNPSFTLEPNAILYRLNSFSQVSKLPASSTITTQFGFEQQLFRNPTLGWREGDAGYAIAFSQSLSSTFFDWIQTQFTYTNRFAPNTNNSPYVTLDLTRDTRNDLSGTILFYLNDPSQYYWRNTSQFSWKAAKWDLYTTEIGIRPNDSFDATLQGGKKLNPASSEYLTQYLPIVLNVDGGSTQNLTIRYDLSIDTNQWINTDTVSVLQSSIGTGIVLDAQTDYTWEFQTTFRYNTSGPNGQFDLRRYELQTVAVAKKEHCQTYQFGYNTLSDEYTFQISVLAFPDDKITFKKTRDQFRLQGILDDATQERL